VLGIAVYRGIYFGGYDGLRKLLGQRFNNVIVKFFVFQGVAILAGIVLYYLSLSLFLFLFLFLLFLSLSLSLSSLLFSSLLFSSLLFSSLTSASRCCNKHKIGLASYPFDTVRRAMMMQAGDEVKLYAGSVDCVTKLVQHGGVASLWSGAASNILRSLLSELVIYFFH
jgi:hypothetical protein